MPKYETISPEAAAALMASGSPVFDVRTPEEYALHHLAGAKLLPTQELQGRHGEIPRNSEKKVLIVCEHGVRSQGVAALLAENGWRNIVSIDGGMAQWMECGLAGEVEKG